jgi:hypothetical protein
VEGAAVTLLNNPRHEKFSQLIASGIKPTEAYISLGYSKAGAPQSANKLLKRDDVRERVNEIQSLAARSTAEEVAFDQKRVLSRLDVLGRKAEELGQISAAVRCEELIGKQRGMFVDRSDHTFKFDLDLAQMNDQQLEAWKEANIALAAGHDPVRIAELRKQLESEAAGATVIDVVTVPVPA